MTWIQVTYFWMEGVLNLGHAIWVGGVLYLNYVLKSLGPTGGAKGCGHVVKKA